MDKAEPSSRIGGTDHRFLWSVGHRKRPGVDRRQKAIVCPTRPLPERPIVELAETSDVRCPAGALSRMWLRPGNQETFRLSPGFPPVSPRLSSLTGHVPDDFEPRSEQRRVGEEG